MEKKIKDYKCVNGINEIKKILVKNSEMEKCAYLIPVTELIFEYPKYIEIMAEWRKNNPTVSNKYFQVTTESTKNWIKNIILDDNTKILFLIFDSNFVPIGQMGLSNINFEKKSGFIYAVIKGDKNAQKGIMEWSLREMTSWGDKELGICEYYLDVQEMNERAIRLYQRVGFVPVARIPLEKREMGEEIHWVVSDKQIAERYDVRMQYILS